MGDKTRFYCAFVFASTRLRIIRLRKYPIDPEAYLELCTYIFINFEQNHFKSSGNALCRCSIADFEKINGQQKIIQIYPACKELFFCLFSCFKSQVNSYGHGGMVSSPNHTFSWAGLNKRLISNLCTYFCL